MGQDLDFPVPAVPAWAVPAQAAPEGSTEPSLVTNSIKTQPVKKHLAQSKSNPQGGEFLPLPAPAANQADFGI